MLIQALRLYRQRKDRFDHFANVFLPLVSDHSSRQDERYPITRLDGTVVGEIRLAVSYLETPLHSADTRVLDVSHTRSSGSWTSI